MTRRALTLMETLVCVALLGLIIALVAGLLRQISRAGSQMDLKNLQQEQLRSIFPTIRREVQSATRWTSPAPGASTSTTDLRFSLPDHRQDSLRFPWPLPTPLPGSPVRFDQASRMVDCRYFANSNGLWRESRLGAITQTDLISSVVKGLAVQRSRPGFLQLSLTLLTSQSAQTFREEIELPMPLGDAP